MGTAHLKLEKLESECEVREIIEVRLVGEVHSPRKWYVNTKGKYCVNVSVCR